MLGEHFVHGWQEIDHADAEHPGGSVYLIQEDSMFATFNVAYARSSNSERCCKVLLAKSLWPSLPPSDAKSLAEPSL